MLRFKIIYEFLCFQESNVLETKNYDLKTQIQDLETQRNELLQMLTEHPCAQRPHQQNQQHRPNQHHQQPQPHHQQQHGHHHEQHGHHQEQYAAETYAYMRQHHHVAAEPPILKDTMFGDGDSYATATANQPPASAYHRPAAETVTAYHRASANHYTVITSNGSGVGYTSCMDDLYGYNKDLIAGGNGGPPDLSHQYYDQSIC